MTIVFGDWDMTPLSEATIPISAAKSQVPVKIMDDVKRIKVKDYSCYAIAG